MIDPKVLRDKIRKQHPLFEFEIFIRAPYKGSGVTVTIRDRSFGWNSKKGFWRWHKATAL